MSEGLKDTSIVWLFSNVDETTGGGAQRGWYPTRQESILRIDRHIDRHIDRYMDRYIDTYIDRYIDRYISVAILVQPVWFRENR